MSTTCDLEIVAGIQGYFESVGKQQQQQQKKDTSIAFSPCNYTEFILTYLKLPFGQGFVQSLNVALTSASTSCECFVFALLREKWQSNQPESESDSVPILRVCRNAQLAADGEHVGSAQGE